MGPGPRRCALEEPGETKAAIESARSADDPERWGESGTPRAARAEGSKGAGRRRRSVASANQNIEVRGICGSADGCDSQIPQSYGIQSLRYKVLAIVRFLP